MKSEKNVNIMLMSLSNFVSIIIKFKKILIKKFLIEIKIIEKNADKNKKIK